ncbi:UNVERIFIED_CONTAM: hypothetical protein FKN15_034261 [Acipenser sinensis]
MCPDPIFLGRFSWRTFKPQQPLEALLRETKKEGLLSREPEKEGLHAREQEQEEMSVQGPQKEELSAPKSEREELPSCVPKGEEPSSGQSKQQEPASVGAMELPLRSQQPLPATDPESPASACLELPMLPLPKCPALWLPAPLPEQPALLLPAPLRECPVSAPLQKPSN